VNVGVNVGVEVRVGVCVGVWVGGNQQTSTQTLVVRTLSPALT
jgi:hypothetical protein